MENTYEVVGDIDIPKPLELGCQDLLREPGVSYNGWLRKKRTLNFPGLWPKVYAVLCGGCFYYFKNEYGRKPAGSFSLYGYSEVKRAKGVDNRQGLWPFSINHVNVEFKTYFFCASSEQEIKDWMQKMKNEMKLANRRNLPPLPERLPGDGGTYEPFGDSAGSFSTLEEPIYDSSAKLRIEIPKDYSVKRQSEASDDEDEITYRPPLPLPREPAAGAIRRDPEGSSEKKKTVEVKDEDDEISAEEYWKSIYFYGDRDEARDKLQSIEEDGVYLVRDGEQGKVLQVYVSPRSRKYRIIEKKGKYTLPVEENSPSFSCIEELVYHYSHEPLAVEGSEIYLTTPWKLWSPDLPS